MYQSTLNFGVSGLKHCTVIGLIFSIVLIFNTIRIVEGKNSTITRLYPLRFLHAHKPLSNSSLIFYFLSHDDSLFCTAAYGESCQLGLASNSSLSYAELLVVDTATNGTLLDTLGPVQLTNGTTMVYAPESPGSVNGTIFRITDYYSNATSSALDKASVRFVNYIADTITSISDNSSLAKYVEYNSASTDSPILQPGTLQLQVTVDNISVEVHVNITKGLSYAFVIGSASEEKISITVLPATTPPPPVPRTYSRWWYVSIIVPAGLLIFSVVSAWYVVHSSNGPNYELVK